MVTAPLENTEAKGAVGAVGASTVVAPLESVGASLVVSGSIVVALIFSLAGSMERVAKKS